jgi:hypothetical protein
VSIRASEKIIYNTGLQHKSERQVLVVKRWVVVVCDVKDFVRSNTEKIKATKTGIPGIAYRVPTNVACV